MRQKRVSLSLIFLVTIGLTGMRAQSSFSASGGNASGSGGTVSYTAGQVVYTSVTGTNGIVIQGVQQPFEISVVTGIEEASNITLEWSVYPNPASDILKINLGKTENGDLKSEYLRYRLYDISGKVLLEDKLDGIETTIQMGGLSSSTYILKIIQTKSGSLKELKTFKIIKN